MLAVLLALTLAGCGSPSSSEEDVMDLSELPTITESQAQMLELIDEVQAAVSAQAPETRPWWWKRGWSSGGCSGDDIDSDGVPLSFPNLVSARPLAEAEWKPVFATVTGIAAAAGLTEVWSPHDSAGSRDVRFFSVDGRELMFGTRGGTLITARISCRRDGEQSLWVGDEIPMPPDPQP